MKTHILISLKITMATLILFGILYPLFVVGTAKLIAPHSGKGEIIAAHGKVVGFECLGQSFTSEKYFNSRPSAVSYNAAATGGSNKGPTNPDYLRQVEERITAFQASNPGIERKEIPVDLVTASGGGLDPHISLQAALIQIPRIANVRGISEDRIKDLVAQYTQPPVLGLFGTTTVHVLRLNIALDSIK